MSEFSFSLVNQGKFESVVVVIAVVARINDAVLNMTCLRQPASKPEYLIPKINRTNIMDFIYQSASGYFGNKIK